MATVVPFAVARSTRTPTTPASWPNRVKTRASRLTSTSSVASRCCSTRSSSGECCVCPRRHAQDAATAATQTATSANDRARGRPTATPATSTATTATSECHDGAATHHDGAHAPRDERRERQPEVVRSGRHLVADVRERGLADALDVEQVVDGRRTARARSRWSRIDWAVTGPMPGRVSSCSSVAVARLMRAPACRRPAGGGTTRDRLDSDEDLLTVGEDASHVERGRVDLAAQTAGLGDGVVHPRTGRKRDDARALHLAHDVDDELAGRGRRGTTGRYRRTARSGRAPTCADAPTAATR